MKIALTSLVTAAVCFGITSATGLASHSSTHGRGVTIPVGQVVNFPALDLSCLYPAKDPDHQERGAILYCNRPSDTNPDDKPASLLVSKYHFKVSATGASGWTYTVWRHP